MKAGIHGYLPIGRTESVIGVAPLPRSRPLSIIGSDDGAIDYVAYVPKNAASNAPLLVCVHGLRRNPQEQIFRLAKFAEDSCFVLLAPHFSKQRFKRFQTLTPDASGLRPEDALDQVIVDWAKRSGMVAGRFLMFGFSGGGQFAHRYAMLGKRRIDALAIASAGWYTLPDPDLPYPFGIGASERLGGRKLNPEHLLEMPCLLMVGSRDIARESSLNTDPLIDKTQGLNRVERAKCWMGQMEQLAGKYGRTTPLQFQEIEGARHNFSRLVERHKAGELLFGWLNQFVHEHQ